MMQRWGSKTTVMDGATGLRKKFDDIPTWQTDNSKDHALSFSILKKKDFKKVTFSCCMRWMFLKSLSLRVTSYELDNKQPNITQQFQQYFHHASNEIHSVNHSQKKQRILITPPEPIETCMRSSSSYLSPLSH